MPYLPKPTQGPLTINVTVTRFVPLPSPQPASGPAYPTGFFTDADFAVDTGATGRPSSVGSWLVIDTSTNGKTNRPYINVANGATGDDDKKNVLQKGIIMHFSILSAPGSSDTYVPLDISFVQYEPSSSNNADINGTKTFPPESVSVPPGTQWTGDGDGNNILEVYNLWGQSHGDDFKWRFFLLIKRVSDGAIGIIDPDLQNEN